MLRMLVFLTVASYALAWPAAADPYWIAYEGNDFPENEGWERTYGDGGWPPQDEPDRWIENGELAIDTSRDDQLWEYYTRSLADPEAAETFIAEWRVRSEILFGSSDNTVVIARSALPGKAVFSLRPDGLLIKNDDVVLALDVNVSHTFRFESPDMISYSLWIDDAPAYGGLFSSITGLQAFTGFGAGTQGAASVSHWDYFRFGVTPEPSSCFLMIGAAIVCNHRKMTRRKK